MSKQTVKKFFIAVLIWLPIQYGIVGIIGFYHSEPWPAFVFPGFKNVYVYEGGFEIAQTRFEVFTVDSEEPMILQPRELFPEIPLSQVPGFMRTHFSDSAGIESFTPQTVRWLERQAALMAGGELVSMDVVSLMEFYSIADLGAVRDSVKELQRTTISFASR
ncbi:MAG: hypothetical protein EA359_04535 [Balneolaceae bacterium]|nr:MAG: hypothetical protein EA359_04535 [Balneolaceae bacterium]